MSSSPETSTPRKGVLTICVLVAIGILVAWGIWSIQAWRARSAEAKALSDKAHWEPHTIGALTLEAPFPFVSGAEITGRLPAEVQELIEATQTSEGKDPLHDLRMTVMSVKYRPGIPLSLDGAAKEAMSSAGAAVGDSHPEYKTTPMSISGNDARRVEYHRTVHGEEIHLICLLICRGRELWQVQAFYSSKKGASEANRILSSVSLAAESAPPRE